MLHAKLPCVRSGSLQDTEKFGAAMAEKIYPGLLLLLYGDLGAGKTQLASAVGRAFGANNVKSPTFAIESIYRLPDKAFSFVHADLYRLNVTESAVMQLEEYLDDGQVVLVEWADKWREPPLENRWDISISQAKDESRLFHFSAFGDRALSSMSEAYVQILDVMGEATLCR